MKKRELSFRWSISVGYWQSSILWKDWELWVILFFLLLTCMRCFILCELEWHRLMAQSYSLAMLVQKQKRWYRVSHMCHNACLWQPMNKECQWEGLYHPAIAGYIAGPCGSTVPMLDRIRLFAQWRTFPVARQSTCSGCQSNNWNACSLTAPCQAT